MDIFQSRFYICSALMSLLSLVSLPQETYSFSIFHPAPPVENANNLKFSSGSLRQFQEPDEYEDETSTPSPSPPFSQEEEEFSSTPEPELEPEPEQSTPATTEQPVTVQSQPQPAMPMRPVIPGAIILKPAYPEAAQPESQSQPEPELQISTLPPTLAPPPTPAFPPTPVPPPAPTTEEDGNIPLENTGVLVGQILSGLLNRDVNPIVSGGTAFVPAGGLRNTVQSVLYQLSPALQQILFGPSPNRRSQPENNNASSPGSPASAGGLLSIPLIPLRSPSGPQFSPPIQPARVQITQGANQRPHLQPFQQPHVINIYLEPNNSSLPVSPAESNAPIIEVVKFTPAPTSPSTTTRRTTTPSTTTTRRTTTTTTAKPPTTPFAYLKIEDDVETTTLKEYIYLVLKQDEYDEFLKYTQRHKDPATATPKPILTEDWFKTKPEIDFLYQNHYQQPDVIVSKPATPSSAAAALPESKYRMKVMEVGTPMTEEEIANFYLTHKNRTLTYYRPKLPMRLDENDILTQFKLGASGDDDEENVGSNNRYILKVKTYQDVLNHSSQKRLS